MQARIRGKLKADNTGISSTNPIAIGDKIRFEAEDEHTAMITEVLPRENYIIRQSPHNRNQRHIIAANIDLMVVIATLISPRTTQGFIDRLLITAEAYHIPAAVIINKTDLLKPKHQEQLEDWIAMYGAAGYPVYAVSIRHPEDVNRIRRMLSSKTTLFTGHSGSGKSTWINLLIPGANVRTNNISESSGKGLHTTTFATMYDLPPEGCIMDTPGMKEFGIMDIEKEELAHYFPEIREKMHACRFNNCLHINEPGCAVKEALADGSIHINRYISYCTLLESIETKW